MRKFLKTLDYAEKNRNDLDTINADTGQGEGLQRPDISRKLRCFWNVLTRRSIEKIFGLGRGDQGKILRQQDRDVCAALPFQLLHQRMQILSVPRPEQAHQP